jgi:hypothetical protein
VLATAYVATRRRDIQPAQHPNTVHRHWSEAHGGTVEVQPLDA